jgi:hypothetical protein
MTGPLPLDSPLWASLTACYSTPNAIESLRRVVAEQRLGPAWEELRGEILHQGTVYGVTSAAIPHLVELAVHLPAGSRRDLWIELGFLVTAGADHFPSPPAPGLQEVLTASIARAQELAVQDFLASTELSPDECSYFALACVALAGHPAGQALWDFPSVSSGYVRVVCPQCETDYEVGGFADPLAPPCPAPVHPTPASALTGAGSAAWQQVATVLGQTDHDRVLGPGFGGFFAAAAAVAAGGVPGGTPADTVWCLIAAMVATRNPAAAPWARTLTRLSGHVTCPECHLIWPIAEILGDGGEPTPIPPAALTSSQPDQTPHPASHADSPPGEGPVPGSHPDGSASPPLPPGSHTVGGPGGTPLLRSRVDGLGLGVLIPRESVADGATGFRPSPQRRLEPGQVWVRSEWEAGLGPVTALALGEAGTIVALAGGRCQVVAVEPSLRPAKPIGAGADRETGAGPGERRSVTMDDSGRERLDGVRVSSPAAIVQAPGVIGVAEASVLRWWDPSDDGLADGDLAAGGAEILSLAKVLMPSGADKRTVDWLAQLRDGRSLIASGDAFGTVRLWDPATRGPVAELFQREGSPVVAMATANYVSQPSWDGSDLITVYGDLTVDVWNVNAVHGKRSTMAPEPGPLAAAGHEQLIGIAISPRPLGFRKPFLLADRNGTVSIWETFGVRLTDPLPADPAHTGVIGIVALPNGDDSILAITASRDHPALRIWNPQAGTVNLFPLPVTPRCLLATDSATGDAAGGNTILIGHDTGLLALSVTTSPPETQAP